MARACMSVTAFCQTWLRKISLIGQYVYTATRLQLCTGEEQPVAYQGPDATLPVAGLTAWGEEGDPCNSVDITSNHVRSHRLHSWKPAVHSWKSGHSLMPTTSRVDLLRQDCIRINSRASKQVQMRQENY